LFFVNFFSLYGFNYVVVLLLYSYCRGSCAFVWFRCRQNYFLIFVMGRVHVSLTYGLPIKLAERALTKCNLL